MPRSAGGWHALQRVRPGATAHWPRGGRRPARRAASGVGAERRHLERGRQPAGVAYHLASRSPPRLSTSSYALPWAGNCPRALVSTQGWEETEVRETSYGKPSALDKPP